MRATAGPALEKTGDIAAILTGLNAGDILFIDEVHRLHPAIEETMYSGARRSPLGYRHRRRAGGALGAAGFGAVHACCGDDSRRFADIPFARSIRDFVSSRLLQRRRDARDCPPFGGDFGDRNRRRSRRRNRPPRAPHAARRQPLVAARARLDPSRKRHAGAHHGGGGARRAGNARSRRGRIGFDRQALFARAHRKFGGGPVGLETLAAAMGETGDTIETFVEPYLVKEGFVSRSPRGRVACAAAFSHFGRKPPPAAARPASLWSGDEKS